MQQADTGAHPTPHPGAPVATARALDFSDQAMDHWIDALPLVLSEILNNLPHDDDTGHLADMGTEHNPLFPNMVTTVEQSLAEQIITMGRMMDRTGVAGIDHLTSEDKAIGLARMAMAGLGPRRFMRLLSWLNDIDAVHPHLGRLLHHPPTGKDQQIARAIIADALETARRSTILDSLFSLRNLTFIADVLDDASPGDALIHVDDAR
jgi:hypothetical protein